MNEEIKKIKKRFCESIESSLNLNKQINTNKNDENLKILFLKSIFLTFQKINLKF